MLLNSTVKPGLRLYPIDKFLTRYRFTSLTPPVYAFHFRSGGLRFMLLGISDIDAETQCEKEWTTYRRKVVRELRVQ